MIIGENPVLSPLDATGRWITAAAEDPANRLARVLPKELDFRAWAVLLRSLQTAALPDTQLGAALLLGPAGLEIASEMAWRARYPAVIDGKRFIGTLHVHPKESMEAFDAADLATFLRSDYPGFLDLLVTAATASAVVRTRRFLYISAERVDRDPLLLEKVHPGFRTRRAPGQPQSEETTASAHAAVQTVCGLYELALYRGAINAPLRLEIRPR
jgi:hypothetical protein